MPKLEATQMSLQEEATLRNRNTVIFGIATMFSRIAGLLREIVANKLYGTDPAAGIFTIASQVPNLLRGLFADMALSAAFVPVFSELVDQKRHREAMLLASTLLWTLLIGLTIITGIAILGAPYYMPFFFDASNPKLMIQLTQMMMPILILLGVNGILVGVLNAYDHFTIPALSPLIWNGVIMVVNIALVPFFTQNHGIQAQAIAWIVGTIAQLLVALPVLKRYGLGFTFKVNFKDPRLREVLVLMIPVAISLGLINFNMLINSKLAAGMGEGEGPARAIEVAFRYYMLPQGIFSVAIVTVLFPSLSRAVARDDDGELTSLINQGFSQILILLVPVGLLLAVPGFGYAAIETLNSGGKWTTQSSEWAAQALQVFGLCLALNGLSLLLSRTLFALKRPWLNTRLAIINLLVNTVVSVALYKHLGVRGIVIGTLAGNLVLVGLQLWQVRELVGEGFTLRGTLRVAVPITVASICSFVVMWGLSELISVGADRVRLPELNIFGAVKIATWDLILLALVSAAGVWFYLGLLKAMRLDDVDSSLQRINSIGQRLASLTQKLPFRRQRQAISNSRPGRGLALGLQTTRYVFNQPFQRFAGLVGSLTRKIVSQI